MQYFDLNLTENVLRIYDLSHNYLSNRRHCPLSTWPFRGRTTKISNNVL